VKREAGAHTDRHATARWTDDRLESLLGNVLRWGVVTAATVVLAGAVVFLTRHGAAAPVYHSFRGEPSDLRTIPGIWGDVVRGSGRGLIQLGLLLLIATPVSRVILSLAVFAAQRDTRYVAITLVVLAVLIYSVFGPYL
jgi:uncharacterized membrane protein